MLSCAKSISLLIISDKQNILILIFKTIPFGQGRIDSAHFDFFALHIVDFEQFVHDLLSTAVFSLKRKLALDNMADYRFRLIYCAFFFLE